MKVAGWSNWTKCDRWCWEGPHADGVSDFTTWAGTSQLFTGGRPYCPGQAFPTPPSPPSSVQPDAPPHSHTHTHKSPHTSTHTHLHIVTHSHKHRHTHIYGYPLTHHTHTDHTQRHWYTLTQTHSHIQTPSPSSRWPCRSPIRFLLCCWPWPSLPTSYLAKPSGAPHTNPTACPPRLDSHWGQKLVFRKTSS